MDYTIRFGGKTEKTSERHAGIPGERKANEGNAAKRKQPGSSK